MTNIQIRSSRTDSAANQGVPAQGPTSNGALYSPHISPALRRAVDADKLLKSKFFKSPPRPNIAPMPAPKPIKKLTTLTEKIALIKTRVAQEFGIPVADMNGPPRKWAVSAIRHIAFYFAIDILKLNYAAAGRRLGRSRCTILKAQQLVMARMAAAPDYAERVNRLRAEIIERLEAGE